MHRITPWLIALLLTACGGGSDDEPCSADACTPTTASTPAQPTASAAL